MLQPSQKTKRKPPIDLTQPDFNKGYISTYSASRTPADGLSDMLNAVLEEDSLPRPRPSLQRYGAEALGDYLGIDTFIKIVDGLPERWQISMQAVGGVGKIYVAKDQDAWTLVAGTYDETAQVSFAQSNNHVYIANGVDNLSFYDIDAGTLTSYTEINTPAAPTPTRSAALVGTTYTLYYKITANNAAGETDASTAGTVQVVKQRDLWNPATDYIDVTWAAVAGATSYNVYLGVVSGSEYRVATGVNGLAFKDDGSAAADPFSLYPSGNSTGAPILSYIINRNGQIFGLGDTENPSYLWYSGTGLNAGDFSPFNGGGYVAINYRGDTVPISVKSFRDGRGTSAVTVLSKGAGGKGRLHHVIFSTTTIGDTTIVYPEVYEANGQSGTYAANGVVEANNSLYYPSGTAFKSTGTKANQVNILITDSISQLIEPDVQNLNLDAMDKCVGVEYEDRIYWSLPVGSSENNQIWVLDLSRRGIWYLRWDVAAKFLWLYEDNNGQTHFMAIVDGEMSEFTRAVATQDNGVAFRTRVAQDGTVFDKAGVRLAHVETQRFKFLSPRGTIRINVSGLGEDEVIEAVGSEELIQTTSLSGFGQFDYQNAMPFGEVGALEFFSKAVEVIPVEIDETVNQLSWEIVTDAIDCDYKLSSIHTQGSKIDRLFYGDE